MELHGDRNCADDKAMIGGLGKIGQQSFMFIGTQKVATPKPVSTATLEWPTPKATEKPCDL